GFFYGGKSHSFQYPEEPEESYENDLRDRLIINGRDLGIAQFHTCAELPGHEPAVYSSARIDSCASKHIRVRSRSASCGSLRGHDQKPGSPVSGHRINRKPHIAC